MTLELLDHRVFKAYKDRRENVVRQVLTVQLDHKDHKATRATPAFPAMTVIAQW